MYFGVVQVIMKDEEILLVPRSSVQEGGLLAKGRLCRVPVWLHRYIKQVMECSPGQCSTSFFEGFTA